MVMAVKFRAWIAGPIQPSSSWCYAYGYCLVEGRRKPALAIQYKAKPKGAKGSKTKGGNPNFAAWYPTTDYDDFLTMKRAHSKGRAVHRYWYTNDYEELLF
jgi:hypothetical protein